MQEMMKKKVMDGGHDQTIDELYQNIEDGQVRRIRVYVSVCIIGAIDSIIIKVIFIVFDIL